MTQYELFSGLNAQEVQDRLDQGSLHGWTVHSFGTGHNGYFWVLFARNTG